MKSVSSIPNEKHIDSPLALVVGGLALATFMIIGGGEAPRDEGDTKIPSSLSLNEVGAPGLVMNEPDFGSVATDHSAFDRSEAIGDLMVVSPHFGARIESVSAIQRDYLR